tara:strand:+ start:207 stop:386 length:180 start_codon:yes stop_codon:yes gene_type:complete
MGPRESVNALFGSARTRGHQALAIALYGVISLSVSLVISILLYRALYTARPPPSRATTS